MNVDGGDGLALNSGLAVVVSDTLASSCFFFRAELVTVSLGDEAFGLLYVDAGTALALNAVLSFSSPPSSFFDSARSRLALLARVSTGVLANDFVGIGSALNSVTTSFSASSFAFCSFSKRDDSACFLRARLKAVSRGETVGGDERYFGEGLALKLLSSTLTVRFLPGLVLSICFDLAMLVAVSLGDMDGGDLIESGTGLAWKGVTPSSSLSFPDATFLGLKLAIVFRAALVVVSLGDTLGGLETEAGTFRALKDGLMGAVLSEWACKVLLGLIVLAVAACCLRALLKAVSRGVKAGGEVIVAGTSRALKGGTTG